MKQQLDVKEDEKHLLLDHAYDDIQELNHPLPRWWNGTFYLCVAFAVVYFVYYQFLSGPTLREEFRHEYRQIQVAKEEFKRQNGKFDPAYYAAVIADDGVKKGTAVYELNCLPCHMEKGMGDVGPNLTDDYWIIAKGTPETIHGVIFQGSEENGMPAWSELIKKEEIYQAVAYVMTLRHTFVKGKEPQGVKIEN